LDKTRRLFPIAIEFADGESPSAKKLNGISKQARQGLNILEYIIGDPWNQSGDNLLNTLPNAQLMIPNIARYIGQTKKINPRIPYLPNIESYTYSYLTAGQIGARHIKLPFKPATVSPYYSWGYPSLGVPTTQVYNLEDVLSAGDWYINTNTGDLYTYNASQAIWKFNYKPVVDGDLGNETTFNVIPDPDTNGDFNGLKVQYYNSLENTEGYYVFLPPRQPLGLTVADERTLLSSPQNIDENKRDGTLGVDPIYFWQASTIAADTSANASHYRYSLPKLLVDKWSASMIIPQGMLYLWDSNSGTILEGLTFTAAANTLEKTYKLVVSGTSLDNYLTSTSGSSVYTDERLKLATHLKEEYPSGGLKLITLGCSLSVALSELIKSFFDHNHGSESKLPTQQISHTNLSNNFDASSTPQLDASALTSDDHPQYLHREGTDQARDKYNNAMLSDLIMASTNSTDNYLNRNADSNKIKFGNDDDAEADLYHSPIRSSFIIESSSLTIGYPNALDTNYLKIYKVQAEDPYIIESSQTALDIQVAETKVKQLKSSYVYDTVYGYGGSGGTYLDGYGPIRRHVIPITSFLKVYKDAGTDNISQFELFPVNPYPITSIYNPALTGYKPTGNNDWGKFALKVGNLQNFNEKVHMTTVIDLPYQQWALCNLEFRMCGTHADVFVSSFCKIYDSYFISGADSVQPNFGITTVAGPIYLRTLTDPIYTAVNTWSPIVNLVTPSATPLSIVTKESPYNTNSSLYITFYNTDHTDDLYITDVTVIYRIKEW